MKYQFIRVSGMLACVAAVSAAATADCTSLSNKLQDGQIAHATDVTNYVFNCPNFAGNVGIGTTNPAVLLHAYNNSSHAEIRVETGAADTAHVPAFSLKNPSIEWSLALTDAGGLNIRENSASYASRVFIRNGGNVGIGTTNPAPGFALTTESTGMFARNYTGNSGIYMLAASGAYGLLQAVNYSNTVGIPLVLQQFGGNVGIGTTSPGYALHVNGTAYATGVAGALSDRRHKKDIAPLGDNTITLVMRLRPVTFRWKAPKDNGMQGVQMGLIAQEVEQVIPTAVLTSRDVYKTKGLKYNELTTVLIKAVQEQQTQIGAMYADSAKLRSRIAKLEAQQVARAQ